LILDNPSGGSQTVMQFRTNGTTRAQIRADSGSNLVIQGAGTDLYLGPSDTLGAQTVKIGGSTSSPAMAVTTGSLVAIRAGGASANARLHVSAGDANTPGLIVDSASSPNEDIARFAINADWDAGDYLRVTNNAALVNRRVTYTGVTTTTNLNLSNGNMHDFTFGAGNETLTFSNIPNSAFILITVIQDGTGSRTITWPATVKWAGGVAPTLTTAANARDQFYFRSDGTNLYEISRSLDVK
jgi:hypothetical protein